MTQELLTIYWLFHDSYLQITKSVGLVFLDS